MNEANDSTYILKTKLIGESKESTRTEKLNENLLAGMLGEI